MSTRAVIEASPYWRGVHRRMAQIKQLVVAGDPAMQHQPAPEKVYNEVEAKYESAPTALYVTSIEAGPGTCAGSTAICTFKHACQLLEDRTHVLATEQDVAAWREGNEIRRRQTIADESRLHSKPFAVQLPSAEAK